MKNYFSSEANLSKKVQKDLAKTFKNDIFFFKHFADANFSKIGIPDIIICLKGFFVALELKVANNKTSEIQKLNLKKIKVAGGYSFEVNEKNWQEILLFLKGIR